MTTDKDSIDVAHRFVRAVEQGDVAALDALLAPDVVVWHNIFEGGEQPQPSREQFIPWLGKLSQILDGLHYTDVRIQPFPGGYVEQHIVNATHPNGNPMAMPAVHIVHVENGQITRFDEYFDSAHAPMDAPFQERVQAVMGGG